MRSALAGFAAAPGQALQVFFLQFGDSHQRFEEAYLQGMMPVDWDDNPLPAACHDEDVVTAIDPRKRPSLFLDYPDKVFAGDLLHTASSRIWSSLLAGDSGLPASSQPWMAS